MDEFTFEWDATKNLVNMRKHVVSFEEARTVFFDELGQVVRDPDHSIGEERFVLLGISELFRLIVVCFCERNKNTIRIISARKDNRFERKHYEDNHHA
ncbi:MAG: BrnT family toxin [Acidimicrobiales bacterium]|nr:MAG: BrnT family toxin [Acidimicrobiales bacterium]